MLRTDSDRNGDPSQRSERGETGHRPGQQTCRAGNGRFTVGQETKNGESIRARLTYSGTTGFARYKRVSGDRRSQDNTTAPDAGFLAGDTCQPDLPFNASMRRGGMSAEKMMT